MFTFMPVEKVGSALLLEEILEVTRDAFVEVYHVLAHHVVSLSGIDEIVGLGIGILAGTEESGV